MEVWKTWAAKDESDESDAVTQFETPRIIFIITD